MTFTKNQRVYWTTDFGEEFNGLFQHWEGDKAYVRRTVYPYDVASPSQCLVPAEMLRIKSGKRTTYTVIYRTGGTENAKWNKIIPVFRDYEDARAKAMEVEKMGYKSIIHDTDELNRIGMPEGWEA